MPKELPEDVEELKRLLRIIATERNDFYERLQLLEHRYKTEMRNKYGRKSETFDPSQLLLFAQQELAAEARTDLEPEKTAERKDKAIEKEVKPRGHGRRRPMELSRIPVIIDVPESEKVCQRCTSERKCFGRSVTLQLDYEPGRAFYWEYVRLKYACSYCESSLKVAKPPEQPIQRGMPAAGMLAHIVTSKYADHLPLHRLEGIFSRQGLVLNRSTMCDWVQSVTKMMTPVFDQMMHEIKKSKVIWTDDTPVRVLDRELKKRTKTGRIWVYRGDDEHPYIAFRFTNSRERAGPLEHLENFRGFLQADAFAGYDAIFVGGGVTEVACLAHARRKFVDAMNSSQSAAAEILLLIQKLYDMERTCKDSSDAERLNARQEFSVPLLAELKDTLDRHALVSVPKSPLAKAIQYTRNQWSALQTFTTCGDLTIDNNLAENALRPIAVGRKNWMFAGSESGGHAIAVMSSIISTCRRLELDPFAYLKAAITKITEEPNCPAEQLLPGRLTL
ncbi:MAG TPA: IS66 family transposase [Oculatellaceae cyanobacterium]